jgi:hypothetical protein
VERKVAGPGLRKEIRQQNRREALESLSSNSTIKPKLQIGKNKGDLL